MQYTKHAAGIHRLGIVTAAVALVMGMAPSLFAQGSSTVMELETTATGFTVTDKQSGETLVASSTSGSRSYEFVSDSVLKVTMDGFDREEFADNGEDSYGAYMMPRGQTPNPDEPRMNNRGLTYDGEFVWAGQTARAPFVMTDRGYAIYAPQGNYFAFDNGISFYTSDATQYYYVIYGPAYREMLQHYCTLAGAPMMPPLWAFGVFGWEDENTDTEDYNAMKTLIDRQIPYTAFWADNPAAFYYENWHSSYLNTLGPGALVDSANAMGYKFLVWTAPQWVNYLQSYMDGCYDLASQACLDKLSTYLKQNVGVESYNIQGFKIDREADYEMGLRFWRESAEVCEEVHGDDWFIFSRGMRDEFRMYSAIWNGDAHYDVQGFKLTAVNALRCGALMYPMFGTDVGGYAHSSGTQNNWNNLGEELACRMFAHGAYCPFMEVPGNGPRSDQANWKIGREFCRQHHYLMPYSRSMMYQAHITGFPVMGAMEFVFPEDGRFTDTWEQYMYGSEILCAPVYESGIRQVDVLVPEGTWINFHDHGQVVTGPGEATLEAPLDIMPQMVRAGAIIPKGNIYKGNQQWVTDWQPRMQLEVFPHPSQSGRSFPYYTGDDVVTIDYSLSGGQVQISFDDLQINPAGEDGVIRLYCSSHSGDVTVNGSSVQAAYNDSLEALEIPFDGATDATVTGVEYYTTGVRPARGRSLQRSGIDASRDVTYRVFDCNGRCQLTTHSRTQLDRTLLQLPRGVYIVKHIHPGQVRMRRISITR